MLEITIFDGLSNHVQTKLVESAELLLTTRSLNFDEEKIKLGPMDKILIKEV